MTELNISLVLYNSDEQELQRLLDSLNKQKEITIKLFIFDNSGQKRDLSRSNFEIDYYSSSINIGFGKAHNRNFLRANSNKHFLVINPDVHFENPLLLRNIVNKTKEKSLTSVRILNPDGSLQEVHRLLPRFSDICRRFILNKIGVYYPYKHTYTLGHIDKTKEFICPNISGCFMLFSPGLFAEVGGFDENIFLYFEDVDLSRRCYALTGGSNKVFGEEYVYHSWKRAGYSNLETFKIHVLSAIYYFQKYGIFRDSYSKRVNQTFEQKNLSSKANHIDALVSVIIPCYNSSLYIVETLQSVLNQTHTNLEIITIDDCSSDNTLEILRQFQKKDKRIIVLENSKNSGISKSRSIGLDKSSGEFIAFVDSDDLWTPDKVEKQLYNLSDEFSFCFSSYEIINESGKFIKNYNTKSRLTYESALEGSPVGFSSTIFHRSAIGDLRFVDTYHEDYIFILEILKKKPAIGVQEYLMKYRKHSKSISANKLKASTRQYMIYRDYLKLSLAKRLKYFSLYAAKGVIKHYF